jgi:hypothetical protein
MSDLPTYACDNFLRQLRMFPLLQQRMSSGRSGEPACPPYQLQVVRTIQDPVQPSPTVCRAICFPVDRPNPDFPTSCGCIWRAFLLKTETGLSLIPSLLLGKLTDD